MGNNKKKQSGWSRLNEANLVWLIEIKLEVSIPMSNFIIFFSH